MAFPQLRLLAAFGLAAACGVAGAGVWMLMHPRPHTDAQNPPVVATELGAQSAADSKSSSEGAVEASPAHTEEQAAGDDHPHASVVEAAGPDHSEQHAEATSPPVAEPAANGEVKRDPRRTQADLVRADDFLRQGDLAKAMQLYSSAIQPGNASVDPVVYFRWALCTESLGLLDESAQRYQALAQQATSPAWKGFARWGSARVLQRQGRVDLAIRIASELWMTHADSAPLWTDDLAHWLGHLLYRRAVDDRSRDLLAESTLASCELHIPMKKLLAICAQIHAKEVGGVLPDPAADDEQLRSPFSSAGRVSDLTLKVPRTTVSETIEQMAKRRQWTVAWTTRSSELARSKPCRLHLTGDAETVIDAACETGGLLWTVENNVMSVRDLAESTADEQDRYQIAVAARSLAYAIDAMPGNRWSDYSRIGLAQLAALREEYAVAERTLEDLINGPDRSSVLAEAWYDLGKLRSRDGRTDEALKAFERCSDHSEGTPLEPVSNLYLGRLQLEAEQTREAILALRRAAALSAPADRPIAVLTLVAAYLADGRPQSANEVLRAYRADLDIKPSRDAAAFLSAFSQVRGATDSFRRKYDQKSLMAAISHVKPDDFFSWQGAALIVDAYNELGLPNEAAQVAAYSVDHMRPCLMRQRLRLVLARDALARNDAEAAQTLLTEIAKTAAGEVRRRAQEQLCSVLLNEGHVAEAKTVALAWLDGNDSPEEQSAALRALGRCLEREGDRLNAALCFAGSRPTIAAAAETEHE